jgi:hypothetical protein
MPLSPNAFLHGIHDHTPSSRSTKGQALFTSIINCTSLVPSRASGDAAKGIKALKKCRAAEDGKMEQYTTLALAQMHQ